MVGSRPSASGAYSATAAAGKQVLCYRRETALQGGLVIAKSGRLELEDNIYGHYRFIFNHCDVFVQQRNLNRRKKNTKIKAITPFKVIQGLRGRYQSKARMRLPISD